MPYRPRHYLASITGKIISMSIAVGPVTRLMTRSLYTLIDSRNSWCQLLMISADARKELQFWLEWIGDLNGQDIWHSPSAIRVVYSDACNSEYGGYCSWPAAGTQESPEFNVERNEGSAQSTGVTSREVG